MKTKHWIYLHGICVHRNLYIFVAEIQVTFITRSVAGQNSLLNTISLQNPQRKSKIDFSKRVHQLRLVAVKKRAHHCKEGAYCLWWPQVAVMLCAEWFLGRRNLSKQRYTGGLRQEGNTSLPGGTNHRLATRISDERALVPEILAWYLCKWRRKIGSVANVLRVDERIILKCSSKN